MKKENRKLIFQFLGFLVFSIVYIGLLYGILITEEIYIKDKIPLYFLEHINSVLFFSAILCYVKKKTKSYYLLGTFSVLILLMCIREDMPFYMRDINVYDGMLWWRVDAITYLYPVCYIGMLLYLLLFPILFAWVKRYRKGKKLLVLWAGILAMGTTITLFLYYPAYFIFICNAFYGLGFQWMSLFWIYLLWIKIGLLLYVYKMFWKEEQWKPEREKESGVFIWKVLISVALLVVLILTQTKVGIGWFIIPREQKIDGYWFIGNVNAFVDYYEPLYPEKRYYVEFVLVSEREAGEKEREFTWWCSNEESGQWLIKTYERKLEAFYYLDFYQEEEYEESNLHPFEYKIYARNDGEGKWGDYRPVLSAETYEGKVFCYQLKSDIPYSNYQNQLASLHSKRYHWGYDFRDIERYDIAIGGKEIPAYFLGMVDSFHIVKVEPYLHFQGDYWRLRGCVSEENKFLLSMRQY